MVGTIYENALDAHHRVAGENTDRHSGLESSIHRRNVFARNATTGDLVGEFVDLVRRNFHRLERDLHLCELTGSTRLLLVGVVVLFDLSANGLAVRNLWLANVCLNVELATHAVDEDVEVELAHTGDNGLASFLVLLHAEGRVFFSQLLDGRTELLLISLGLRLNSNRDNRLRERHRLEHNLVVRVAQRVSRGRVFQTDDRVDVTGGHVLDRVLLVGVHLEDLADALFLALGCVGNRSAGVDLTGVHANVGQTTEEWVNSNLECETGERVGRNRVTFDDLLFVAHVVALCCRNVERAGEVVNNCVEHRLYTAVLEGRATENRVDLGVDGHLADGLLDLGYREVGVTLEEAVEKIVVAFGNTLDELLAVLVGLVDQVSRDLFDLVLGAELNVTL
ncbi:unannotated protein [freshwater metagenome]|uniref:Unannotated protein n=1 Tax=freshwater metagenome TaxID=449393 RepID=A0A6J6EC97_9ZZZZ